MLSPGPWRRLPTPFAKRRLWFAALATVALSLFAPTLGIAQSRNQFGRADRAAGAGQLITLAVQQAISQLPPTAGQSFTFRFDPGKDTFVRSDRQGPTVLLSPRTIGKGTFSARMGVSYFRLSGKFDPVFYRVEPKRPAGEPAPSSFTKFGLEMSADVVVVDLSATYGVARWLDVFLDLPIVVVDASADQLFFDAGGSVQTVPRREMFDPLVSLAGYSRQSLADRGAFNEGTHVGVGRIGLGARTPFYANQYMELGAVTRFSFASPSSEEFAGSDSYAIYPRLVGEFFTEAPAQLFVDVGYEYDFSFSELSRFAWDVGVSMPFTRGSVDIGVGGSIYDSPIKWTPDTAQGDPTGDSNGLFANGSTLTLDVAGQNEVDNDTVNLLLGGKFAVTENVVLSGAVTVALTNNGVRPDAVGTLAFEVYL